LNMLLFAAMGRRDQPLFNQFLKSSLSHENPKVRLNALIGLLNSSNPQFLPDIDKMLKDAYPEVRLAAAAGYTSIAAQDIQQLPNVQKKIQATNDSVIYCGGALGYIKILYDVVPFYISPENQWNWEKGYTEFLVQLINGIIQEIKTSAAQQRPRTLDHFIAYVTAALELVPSEPRYWIERGVLYLTARQNANAIADFRKALELKPDFNIARLWLARAYWEQQNAFSAISELEKYEEAEPLDLAAMQLKAQCYIALGKMNQAKALQEKIQWIKTHPKTEDE